MKDAYYFPHDSNARQDPKIIALCSRHGLIAYACYFHAIEILREQSGYCLDEKFGTAITQSWQCYGDGMTIAKASSIFGDMFEFGLLERRGGNIFSRSLNDRMIHLDDLRRKRSEAGKKGAAKLWQSHGNVKALSSSKVKESKGKERKETLVADATTPKPLTEIQKIVTVYKLVSGYPKEDTGWDKINFARCAKSAKSLLEFMGNWKDAGDCIQDVYEKLTSKGLTVTLETVVKHASDWKKDRQEKGKLNGILSVPGTGHSSSN